MLRKLRPLASPEPAAVPDPAEPIDPAVIRRARLLLEPLSRYHRFTLVGVEHMPRVGRCLLVVHHSMATYDGFLLSGTAWKVTGRLPRGLGDDTIFRIPLLAGMARAIGLVPASPEAGARLLQAGHLLAVAPGGMWESLRPRGERRQSRWQGRKGFARLALRTQSPILCAACPAADDIYTVYPSRLTDQVYHRTHWPLPLLRGLGLSLVPRPVKLTGYLAPPILPPLWEPEREDAQVDALYAQAHAAMTELLKRP